MEGVFSEKGFTFGYICKSSFILKIMNDQFSFTTASFFIVIYYYYFKKSPISITPPQPTQREILGVFHSLGITTNTRISRSPTEE